MHRKSKNVRHLKYPATMAKLTILLCALFIAGGTEGGVITDTIEKGYEKVDEVIDSAIAAAHEAITGTKKLAAELFERLADAADLEIDRINEKHQANYERIIHERTGKTLREIVEWYQWSIPTQCKVLALAVRDYMFETAEATSICVREKIEVGKQHFENITNISDDVITELSNAKNEAKSCIGKVDGVTSTVGAVACLTKVGVKASWINVQRIPEITACVGKLAWTVSSFHTFQGKCSSASGLKSIPDTLEKHIANLEICVKKGNTY